MKAFFLPCDSFLSRKRPIQSISKVNSSTSITRAWWHVTESHGVVPHLIGSLVHIDTEISLENGLPARII